MKTKNRIWLIPLIVMGLVLIITNSCKKSDDNKNPSTSITDKDGNVYTSVTIGTQVWMVENLKTTKLNDGSSIPYVTDGGSWENLETPGYCWYNNDAANKTPYGALYNWYAVNTGKLCPTGWHVPLEAESMTLVTYLGGVNITGAKLKESGTAHWISPNTGATNVSGFTALPGGYRLKYGSFDFIGHIGWFWMATPMPGNQSGAETYNVNATDFVGISYGDNRTGISVRCLKD